MISPIKTKSSPHSFIYQLKVTLLESKPSIWRRFHVPDNIKLSRLHDVLQVVMGWTNSHLHQFRVGEDIYGPPQDVEFDDPDYRDERRYILADIAACQKDSFLYEYDFGDDWVHKVEVEAFLPPNIEKRVVICTHGSNACPPEDCGGLWGYTDMLDAISNPKHERHEESIEWIGGAFDPKHFDLEQVNTKLKRLKI